MKRTYMVNI